MRRTRGACLALIAALLVTGCVPSPPAPPDPIATEVAIRLAVNATLTALAPAPQEIAFQSDRDGNWEIYLMNADGSRQRNLTQHPANDRRPAWSPDGDRLAFVSDRDPPGVYVMRADGTGQELVRAFDLPVQEIAWSPDGGRLAVLLGINEVDTDVVWIVRTDGTGAVRLAEEWMRIRESRWSPDGEHLAFTVADSGMARLAVANVDSREFGVIVQMTRPVTSPAWSPDGQWIAFTAGYPAQGYPFAVRRDGSELRALPGSGHTCGLTWHPGGSVILYVGTGAHDWRNITLVTLEEDTHAALPPCTFTEERVTWSPDGEHLAIACQGPLGSEILSVRRDGSEPLLLTTNAVSDSWPAWRP